MSQRNIVFLMYHEIELPKRPLVQSEPGYVRYIVSQDAFHSQMNWLQQNGWRGLSVGEALSYPAGKSVAITFDDGTETDLIAAAPILKEKNYNATFYVTSGFLNKNGYMSSSQLKELFSLGFEIGCHSMTHPDLDSISDAAQKSEVIQARARLEDIIGKKVEHFSCPGGRYNTTTLSLAKQSGYRSLATSHVHANSPTTDPFQLGRAVIMRDTNEATFQQICMGNTLWKMRLAESTRGIVRNFLGTSLYNRVRTRLLHRS